MKYELLFISLFLFLSITSCNRGNGGSDAEGELSVPEGTGEITLSRAQFESAGMKIGNPTPRRFSNSIRTNGYIVASRKGGAKISTLISGRVRQINYLTGDYVQKGASLFLLESNEIILLQQTYAEANQQLQLMQTDYERLKLLSEENIVAQKDFLKAESDFKRLQATVAGLKARLLMIYIDPSQVERGEIVPYISVKSPINGSITKMELVLGQNVEQNENPVEIIDTEQLRLRLQVFEDAIGEVQIGQEVLFSNPNHPDTIFKATLNIIGKEVSTETRSIECYAIIDTENKGLFLNKMYVEAEIITCEREALALPEQALIKEHDKDYALILVSENENQFTFRKIPVQTGATRQGYTEILENDLSPLLIEGVYNLMTEE